VPDERLARNRESVENERDQTEESQRYLERAESDNAEGRTDKDCGEHRRSKARGSDEQPPAGRSGPSNTSPPGAHARPGVLRRSNCHRNEDRCHRPLGDDGSPR
jgi:hypothetical protein